MPTNYLSFFQHERQPNFPISSSSITILNPPLITNQWSSQHLTQYPGNTFSLLISSFHIITSSQKTMFIGLKTPDSHIFSADIPGVRKEELRVEVEDSRYLVIRTEAVDESTEPARKFKRKFRLPGRVDLDGISAGYENGVLTVTVPRSLRRGFYIDPVDVPDRLELLARAA